MRIDGTRETEFRGVRSQTEFGNEGKEGRNEKPMKNFLVP